MTTLIMTPELIISSILLAISFVSFIFMYNKALKNRVDKTDLKELKEYVDKQDRGIHARIGETHKTTNDKLDIIIERLIK